jgi:hypothetical protein
MTEKMSGQALRDWMADTVTLCLDEALGRFHNAGVQQGLTPAATRVLIATSGIPQHLRTQLAARYSEIYETSEKHPDLKGAVEEVLANLPPGARAESQVYWNKDISALILVGGEKGVRKQWAIIVNLHGSKAVAKVGDWGDMEET